MPKKNKTLFVEIPVNPYVVEIWLLITDNPHFETVKLNQKHKGLNFKWPDDAAAVTEDVLYKDNYLLVVFDGRQRDEVYFICHEVIHIKNVIMKQAGIKLDPDNDEAEAYLSGWIAEQIHKAWKEYKKL